MEASLLPDILTGLALPLMELPSREEMEEEVEKLMSQTNSYDADIVIIGAGPGGYVCAIRAAQLGARVVCIEKKASEWGGVCLNWGCIPTKAMIASVERLHAAKQAKKLGILVGDIGYDFGKIMDRKNKIVSALRGGVESLLKSNNVRRTLGTAKITGKNSVEVTADDGSRETITTKNIIIATGSEPIIPPVPGLEGENIWTSNDAVNAPRVPASMLIIGAGAVGLEFSYVFNGLGAKCTVVEMMQEALPPGDKEMAAELRKSLTRQGIQFHLSTKVTKVERIDGLLRATISGEKGDQTIDCEVILVGAGRRPRTENLGLEELGIEATRRGITVDDHMQTNVPGIFAIGDVTGKLALAHVASHQGIVAAENAMGHSAIMEYRAIPSPVFTEPEMAWVGMTEQEAKDAGYDVMIGRFPFRPLGKAMAIDQQEGSVKVVAESKYGEVLGVHIVGPHASDLIHEAVMAIKLEATVEELMTMVHAHPTLAEAILEASLDVKGEAIHKLKS
jgi:dihydrolipoamide dehydrogenase